MARGSAKDHGAKELVDLGDKLFSKRSPLDTLWQEIAENFYPERADFTSPHNFGDDFAAHLMDSFPVLMRRELANSISAMLRPRDRPWFRSTTLDDAIDDEEKNAKFLEYIRDTMRRKIYDARSQFIRATKQADHDFVTFGNAVLDVDEDRDREHLFFRGHHLRDCVWLENRRNVIDHLHRRDKMTARNMKREFGEENLHPTVKQAAEKEPDKEFTIRCVVMPADEYNSIKNQKNANGGKLPFVICYVDVDNCKILKEAPRATFQYVVPRWHTITGWQYAFSPATIIALPDARLAQQMARILLESGEKAVDPPAIAKMEAVRETNIQAGALTWVDISHDEKLSEAFQLLEFKGDMRTGFAMRADLREMLTKAFFLDKLNLPPSEGGEKMTAEEVRRRLEEFVRSALPLFEPMEIEYNTQVLDKSFETLRNMKAFDFSLMPKALGKTDVTWAFESPIQAASSRMAVSQFQESLGLIAAAAEAGITSPPVDLNIALRAALRATAPAKWLKSASQMEAEDAAAAEAAETKNLLGEVDMAADLITKGSQASMALGQAMQPTQPALAAPPKMRALPPPKKVA